MNIDIRRRQQLTIETGGVLDRNAKLLASLAASWCMLVPAESAWGADWTLSKQLTVQATYSDNVDLEDSGGEGDFFIELTPGIAAQAKGRRLSFDLAYSLQALKYLSTSSEDKINHRLQFDAQSELYRDHFFVDASIDVDQELIDPLGPAVVDATSTSDNLQTTSTYSISPYYVARLGRQAELTVRLEHDGVLYGETGGDSYGYRTEVELNSGSAWQVLQFGITGELEQVEYSDGPSNRFSTIEGTIGYRLNRLWLLEVSAGYEDNDYVATNETTGAVFESSLTWTPNPRTTIMAGVVKRYFDWSPKLDLSYRRKRSVWTASYERDVSSAREDRARRRVFSFEDAFGETVTPDTGASPGVPVDSALPSSAVFISHRFDAAWTVQTRRSTLGVSLGYVLREYEEAAEDDGTISANIDLSRRLGRKTSGDLSLSWSQRETRNTSTDETTAERDQYSLTAGLSRQVSARASTDLQYGLRDSGDGIENRITLGLQLSW